jgi:hypothetical protein
MRTLVVLGVLLAAAGPAAADVQYAIVVGANHGGAGQADLRFAADDARRVSELLTELGGYAAADVTVVAEPTPQAVLAAIDAVGAKAAADRAAGTPATVFFYYSGHAKAAALNLGDRELALGTLRDRLLGLPTALTVVVLDACQSGAFSRVKGAEPAADFSFNSRSRLDATGVAVLASSTGSELSQESELLGSGYFTHHLLIGLRGAADASKDGRVTIDEAYRYAYHQTLLATAQTAVGGQHVSLEVDLKGHGEVPLSYPEQATAQLELPAALAGDILVERAAAKAVLAELHKVAGDAIRVALAPGEYRVLVRRDKKVERCPVVVRDGATSVLALTHCEVVPQAVGVAKGGAGRAWTLAIALGAGAEYEDAFTDRLREFGYDNGVLPLAPRIGVTARWRLGPHVQLGGSLGMTGSTDWTRPLVGGGGEDLRFSWLTLSALGIARLDHTPALAPRTSLFVQGAAGLGLGRTTLVDEADQEFSESSLGPVLGASTGMEWNTPWWPRFGFGLQYSFAFAPVITNLTGDRHLGLGHFVDLTFHYRL